MKILFHVDQAERWTTCLGNVYNTLKYFDEKAVVGEVEIVANAVAVKELSKIGAEAAGIAEEMSHYIKKGVKVLACRNALIGQQIHEEELLEGVGVVDAAIIEIAEKQSEGWAYIRP